MLSADDRDDLAAFADGVTPSEAQTSAALARTRERILAGGAAAAVDPAQSRGGRGPWIMAGAALLLSAAAIVLVLRGEVASMFESRVDSPMDQSEFATPGATGGRGGEASVRSAESKSAVRRRSSTSREDASPAEAEVAPPEAPLEISTVEGGVPEAGVPPEVVPPQVVPARPKKRTPKPAKADATLHAEMAVLRPAKAALRAGDHARALRRFDDHAASFPDSPLGEERDLGRIEALCGLGRLEAAAKATKAFVRSHPGSPLRSRAERACAQDESP